MMTPAGNLTASRTTSPPRGPALQKTTEGEGVIRILTTPLWTVLILKVDSVLSILADFSLPHKANDGFSVGVFKKETVICELPINVVAYHLTSKLSKPSLVKITLVANGI